MRLVRATQTSAACPAQWDAYDEDGNYWYLRYRYGVGQACRLSGPDFNWDEYVYPRERLTFAHGRDLDGYITLDEFALRAGFTLAADLREVDFDQHMSNELHAQGVADAFIDALGLPDPRRENDDA